MGKLSHHAASADCSADPPGPPCRVGLTWAAGLGFMFPCSPSLDVDLSGKGVTSAEVASCS